MFELSEKGKIDKPPSVMLGAHMTSSTVDSRSPHLPRIPLQSLKKGLFVHPQRLLGLTLYHDLH